MPRPRDFDQAINPYAPPEATLEPAPPSGAPGDLAEAEAIRRKHLNHEASIRAVGSLHLLGALIYGIGGGAVALLSLGEVARGGIDPRSAGFVVAGGLVLAGLVALNLAMGLGLRGLRNWARWVEVALLGIVLLLNLIQALVPGVLINPGELVGVFFGSLIPVYILYLLVSEKGRVVFSPGYRDVIALTPHIKYKVSLLVKVLVAILLAVIGLGVIAAIFLG